MEKELPSDFDWVTARRNCSGAKVMELLSLEAKKNVESIKTINQGRVREPVQYVGFDGGFSIVTDSFRSTGLRFSLMDDNIYVHDSAGQLKLTASLTLNDQGKCRLLVEGQELDRWQLLKRVLEPLFFSAER